MRGVSREDRQTFGGRYASGGRGAQSGRMRTWPSAMGCQQGARRSVLMSFLTRLSSQERRAVSERGTRPPLPARVRELGGASSCWWWALEALWPMVEVGGGRGAVVVRRWVRRRGGAFV